MHVIDTSVWIRHLRTPQPTLIELLKTRQVLIHSAVIGELACGNIPDRQQFLQDIASLPAVQEANSAECLHLIDQRKLFGTGLGWIDVQLLASAILSRARILTFDKTLEQYSRLAAP